jgi:uncharacterized membrane protein
VLEGFLMIETESATQLKRTNLLLILLVAQITLAFSVIFNISVAQLVLGFLFVSIFPGFVIVQLLMPQLERVEKIIFAVGASLAFFMGIGLLINFLGPIFGISKPLELVPTFIVTSIIMDALAFYNWRASDHYVENSILATEPQNKRFSLLATILCLLPLLSVIGALQVSVPPYSNNLILLLLPLVISVLVLLVAIYKQLPSEVYVSVLFAIALTLLLQFSFFSPYLVGGDIFSEYLASISTLQHSFWNIQVLGRLNAMLSVTILPTIYSNTLGTSVNWIFKVVYPTIFALVPLGVYQLFKSQMTKKIAFLSVFFFMSNLMFFQELPELPRQMIGELFFILLILTIFKKDFRPSIKLTFFTIFSFGIIVSHYAMAYIFLGFIVAFWLINLVTKRKNAVTISMITIFAVILFSWYIYAAAGATFGDLVSTVNMLQQNFVSGFLNPQSRGSTVLEGVGVAQTNTILHQIGQYTFDLAELLVVIGFVASLVKHKGKFFKNDFYLFAFFSLLLLGACIVVPNFANTFNAERFYQIALFFLAPFCIVGGLYILSFLSRNKISVKFLELILILLVLIPVFLFQTGFAYEVTKQESYALPLSSYRLDPLALSYQGILTAPEVSGAEWLSQNRNFITPIYSDHLLLSSLDYANIQNPLFLSLGASKPSGSIIYLMQYNILKNVVYTQVSVQTNLTQVIPPPDTLNTIYSSGSCIIYEAP